MTTVAFYRAAARWRWPSALVAAVLLCFGVLLLDMRLVNFAIPALTTGIGVGLLALACAFAAQADRLQWVVFPLLAVAPVFLVLALAQSAQLQPLDDGSAGQVEVALNSHPANIRLIAGMALAAAAVVAVGAIVDSVGRTRRMLRFLRLTDADFARMITDHRPMNER